MKEITRKQIDQFNLLLTKKDTQSALRRVLFNNDLNTIFTKQEKMKDNSFYFSNEIKTLPVANQKRSGRCWIFAGLNVLREVLAAKYELSNFELSQNYVAFWDKFEKINYFIESIDDFLDVDYDDRTLQHILKTGIQDGGQWDMFVSLVLKYGVVPQADMPETNVSSNTGFMNGVINLKLRKYVAEARKHKNEKEKVNELKKELLEELYIFLTTCFGVPPKEFDFEYKAKDKVSVIKGLTPQSFYYEHIGDILNDYVSVINAPTFDKPFLKTYTVAYLGNVVGGKDIKYLNLEMNRLKELTINQLKNNEVVWFGCDVSRFGDRVGGIWDDELFDYDKMLEMNLQMSKNDQLIYSQSAMNHAMVLTGVHLDDNVSKRFKIQNSWGKENGKEGYYVASDSFFEQYVYQAIINIKYLTEEELKAWKQAPIILKPWDPMGSLAK